MRLRNMPGARDRMCTPWWWIQDVSQKVWGAEKAWEPVSTPGTIFQAGSCLCTAVLNPFTVLSPFLCP